MHKIPNNCDFHDNYKCECHKKYEENLNKKSFSSAYELVLKYIIGIIHIECILRVIFFVSLISLIDFNITFVIFISFETSVFLKTIMFAIKEPQVILI